MSVCLSVYLDEEAEEMKERNAQTITLFTSKKEHAAIE